MPSPFSSGSEDATQDLFKQLKVICVPLLSRSLLTAQSTPQANLLLSQLLSVLQAESHGTKPLNASFISYVFFPVSSILRRNPLADIPAGVLEKILLVLGMLCESWWTTCDMNTWEQLFMMVGSVLGGVDAMGKRRALDEETRLAAVKCLAAVLRGSGGRFNDDLEISLRLQAICQHVQAARLLPALGKILDALLDLSESHNIDLQTSSLRAIATIVADYVPADFAPSILPGLVSSMTRIALGGRSRKGWANGDVVFSSLDILQHIIINSIGDSVCADAGIIQVVTSLEDLAASPPSHTGQPDRPDWHVERTKAWLSASASQIHIALNALTPLTSHTHSAALRGLGSLARSILREASLTLVQSRPLLLSFLLTISQSDFDTVAASSRDALVELLPTVGIPHALLHLTRENLTQVSRALHGRGYVKVAYLAAQVIAACSVARHAHELASGVRHLLGPAGGVERWGVPLLSALEFTQPPAVISLGFAGLLESAPTDDPLMPTFQLQNFEPQSSIENMLRALGGVGGADALFCVEWLVEIGLSGSSMRHVAALWCAARIVEGCAGLQLLASIQTTVNADRLEKVARWSARSIAELWEGPDVDVDEKMATVPGSEDHPIQAIEYRQGLIQLETRLDIRRSTAKQKSTQKFASLHRSAALQLLAISATTLRALFGNLLLHALYPVLHSLVADDALLVATAEATLAQYARAIGFATPANLLLANFDYALDSAGRRLARKAPDVAAARVLRVLVRLVGPEVVRRAGDVVQDCFTRLDELHGYPILVEGIVNVLLEVVRVLPTEVVEKPEVQLVGDRLDSIQTGSVNALLAWLDDRSKSGSQPTPPVEDAGEEDGEVPRMTGRKENDDADEPPQMQDEKEVPPSSIQTLTNLIISRSIPFLTHSSPLIRARILTVLTAAVPVLLPDPDAPHASLLLQQVHKAWPFVLNRLGDSEPFVAAAAAQLVEALCSHAGSFMARRMWDDVWPRFREMLQATDAHDVVRRRPRPTVPTHEYAQATWARIHAALLGAVAAAATAVEVRDDVGWEMLLAFRRFLDAREPEELQNSARKVYISLRRTNEDAVWLALSATVGHTMDDETNGHQIEFPRALKSNWDITANAKLILV